MHQILRVQKLKSIKQIRGSAGHTYREISTPNADPSRTHLNERTGAVGRDSVVSAVKARMEGAERAKGSVLCAEYLITASPEFFKTATKREVEGYFSRARDWLIQRHGAENVVATDLQLDESTPHLVAYVVPRVEVAASSRKRSVVVGKGPDGKAIRETRLFETKAGSKLSAAHWFDGRDKLEKMQDHFYQVVAAPAGLGRGVKGSTAEHQDVKRWYGELKPRMEQAQKMSHKVEQARVQVVEAAKKLDLERAELKAERTRLEQLRDYIQQQKTALTERLAGVYRKIRRQLVHDEIRAFEVDFKALGIDVSDRQAGQKMSSGLTPRQP